jgi:hypothetical protein
MIQDTSTQQLLQLRSRFKKGMVFKSEVGFGILMSEGQYNFVTQDTENTIYFMKMLILKTFSLLENS